MTTQVTISLPDEIYQRAEAVALQTERPIAEILAETIQSAFSMIHTNPNRPAMQREVTAFEAQHDALWRNYPNQFVAIHRGVIIDHDDDEVQLTDRIAQTYPNQPVLIRQVLPNLPAELRAWSPRFID